MHISMEQYGTYILNCDIVKVILKNKNKIKEVMYCVCQQQ